MMSVQTMRSTVLVAIACAFAGCDARKAETAQAVSTEPTIDVAIAGRPFKLEVADTDAERQTGLMNRKTMPADHGMLFVFEDVAPRTFWMKNTLLPLDIAYLDKQGTVLNVAQMEPNDLTSIPSAGPAMYAIELNQGVGAQIGLKRGDHIAVPATSGK